ncbi:hypothetical protein VA7868_02294 [Vibrio aerogenes CECT 7868]|uniref:YbjQ family protein n=1 Tax=Vibrio aerogenes CECT 7868 TaxID=1216006 RepID=A0A1M5Z501_9VIBR|nr:heavy metal-binding domain-containing protein [Vibrio aerogenes]SHI19261.1 hypothetical protein VA7868_02294 [Vibrio aerogenes CECT 7868]
MNAILSLITFIVLISIGYFAGRWLEKRHYQRIFQREEIFRDLVVIPGRQIPAGVTETTLVCGSVVISVDYFKRILAGLRMIFGGRLNSYESLLDRARREAILRVQEQASDLNAFAVYNLKMETSSVSKGRGNNIGSIEVIAYGTALIK